MSQLCQPQNPGNPNDQSFEELGGCLATYEGTLGRNPVHLVGLLAGAGFFGYVTYRQLADGAIYTKEAGLNFGLVVMSAATLVCLGLLVRAMMGANCDLLLLAGGLVFRRGDKVTKFRWDDIEGIYEGVTVSHMEGEGPVTNFDHRLRFKLRDQREVKIDLSFVPDSEEASAIIMAETFPRLLGAAAQKLSNGQPVELGKVTLQPDGLGQIGDMGGKYFLAFSDFGVWKIDNGFLTISKPGGLLPWLWRPVAEIPNFRVLLAFLEHFLNGKPLPGGEQADQERELVGAE